MIRLNSTLILSVFSLLFFLTSCGNDDSTPDNDPVEDLESMREATTQEISEGDTKTWRIATATLINDAGSFDISNNFNVKDDEFIFRADQSLVWRAGNDINVNASSVNETLLDFYRSPVTSSFDFEADSSTEATALNGSFAFEVIDENNINGTLTLEGRSQAGTLEITLVEKAPGDYVTAPVSNGLNFSEAGTFQSNLVVQGSVGMTGSYADNSLMVITREDGDAQDGIVPEKIFKLSLDNGTLTTNLFFQPDFVTKRPHIINGELVVVGGRYVNIYDLANLGDPVSTTHNANNDMGLTRFGSAVQDDNIFITGGDLGGNYENGDKIRQYNNETGNLEVIATLPETRYWGETEIVNNKLYVFGGRLSFVSTDYETTSFVYDLDSGNLSTFDIPLPCWATYTVRNEHLIYLAGQTREDFDNDGTIDDINVHFWVYNTLNDQITEIQHDLDDSDQFSTISGLTLFNGKLYVVFGDASQPTDPIATWSIMEASIQ